MDIRHQRVCITGASAGIGEACAEAFAAQGAHVLLIARRQDRIDSLATKLAKTYGVETYAQQLDVRNREDVARFAENLPEKWRDFDILVNNAGLSRGLDPIHRGSIDDWEEMIDTNIKGLLYMTHALVQRMVQRGRGHLIQIGSIAGHEVYPSGNVYCATKHAVKAINRGMCMDLMGSGVRVTSVDPGMVETEFSIVRFHGDEHRAKAVYQGVQPLSGDDVAQAVLFCATRPPHANVREMVLLPSVQGSANHTKRA